MKRGKLMPEVAALLRVGLSPIDAEWICRLKPESQLAAARKCLQPNPTFNIQEQSKSSITHGTPSIQERR